MKLNNGHIQPYLYKLNQDLIKVTKWWSTFHIKTQLLFKISPKGNITDKASDQVAYHFSLIIQCESTEIKEYV